MAFFYFCQKSEERGHAYSSGLLRSRSRPLNAFTLVEIMIAVVVVSVGVAATFSMFTFSHLQNALEQERSRAHQLICQKMEEVRQDLQTRITPGTQVTVWDNGTPDNNTDDTVGTIAVIVRDPKTGVQYAAGSIL